MPVKQCLLKLMTYCKNLSVMKEEKPVSSTIIRPRRVEVYFYLIEHFHFVIQSIMYSLNISLEESPRITAISFGHGVVYQWLYIVDSYY